MDPSTRYHQDIITNQYKGCVMSHYGLAILHQKVSEGKRRIMETQIFYHAKI
jgi:hypothetical protein